MILGAGIRPEGFRSQVSCLNAVSETHFLDQMPHSPEGKVSVDGKSAIETGTDLGPRGERV